MTWAEELSQDLYGQRQVRAVETYLSLAPWRGDENQQEQTLLRLFHANRVYGSEVLIDATAQYRFLPRLIQFVTVLNGISAGIEEEK